jgi:hypothetical protein
LLLRGSPLKKEGAAFTKKKFFKKGQKNLVFLAFFISFFFNRKLKSSWFKKKATKSKAIKRCALVKKS